MSWATLYRYFPTREQLLQALTTAGLNEAATRLAEADLDAVPVPEAIARRWLYRSRRSCMSASQSTIWKRWR